MRIMVVPIFLPHFGCVERCIYCHQGYITDTGHADIKARIDTAFMKRTHPCDVGLFGGNIFGIEPAVLRMIFSFFEPYRDVIKGFRLSTKPVPVKDEMISLLKENKVDIIELGIPTFNDTILASLNRAHTGQDLFRAYDRLRNEGFTLALQFMVGLPGEREADIEDIVRNMVLLKPAYIRIYPLVILKNTLLYSLYQAGEFAPDPFDDVLGRACRIYGMAVRNGIEVANVGLTDNELVRDMVVGGHYHPAYGFLVQSLIFVTAVEDTLGQFENPAEVTVILHRNDIPLLIGHKKENIAKLAAKGITVHWDPSGKERGKFRIVSGGRTVAGTAVYKRES
ncbi:MAG: Radical domain protein [Deltaproteobacteria bacterium]|nr:Radical domain protein [Deltaproteobacteria bacterium]